MGNVGSTQKYRYKGSVVEVVGTGVGSGYKSNFVCLVRGYGHNNPAPRRKYTIEAESAAKASRLAFQKYENDFRAELYGAQSK